MDALHPESQVSGLSTGNTSIADLPPEGSTDPVRELERRQYELAVLTAISGVAARSPEVADILAQTLRRLREVMEVEAGAVFLMSRDGLELVRAASIGFSEHYQRDVTRLKIGDQLTGRVARIRQPIFIEDIGRSKSHSTAVMRGEGHRTFSGIPLISNDRVLGVMTLAAKKPQKIETAQRSLLLSVGNMLAVSIDNAQLFQETTRLAVVEERSALSREIHDTLAQGLVALVLQLELAIAQLEELGQVEAARASLHRSLELARENLEESRRSIAQLRGVRVAVRELGSLLDELAAELRNDAGVLVRTSISRRLGMLPVNLSEGLYRIAQEALVNVRNHSQATTVQLSLRSNSKEIILTVRDDGVGFNPLVDPGDGRFGIHGMGERSSLLGGRLDLQSEPGHGTLVRVVAPLQGPVSTVMNHD